MPTDYSSAAHTPPERLCWELFAVMEGDKFIGVVAKDPNRPVVIDITTELAKKLHHARSGGPLA